MAEGLALEPPPRTTGNAHNDFPLIVDWIYKFYDVVRSSYISANTIRQLFVEKATSWNPLEDDLSFPVQGIGSLGAASDPVRNASTGALEFSGTADNVIAGVAQMPHAWQEGSALRPHIHVQFPTAASAYSRWKIEYSIANIGEDFPAVYGSYSKSEVVTVRNPSNLLTHCKIFFSEIDMTGKRASSIVLWRISRLAATDALDTDTTDIALFSVDFHYLSNRDGTVRS